MYQVSSKPTHFYIQCQIHKQLPILGFNCILCKKNLSLKSKLTHHMATIHSETCSLVWKCFVFKSRLTALSQPFPPIALRRHHAQTFRDKCSSYKKDYVIIIKDFLNPEGHQNPFTGVKVTAILLKGGFCLLVELLQGRVCACSLRSRLVCIQKTSH